MKSDGKPRFHKDGKVGRWAGPMAVLLWHIIEESVKRM